jgi:hypothetical protein
MTTIRLNKEDLVEKTIDEKINELNATGRRGGWEIHIQSHMRNQEVINAKPFFHQEGNYYGREVGHVCEFGAFQFFNWDGRDMDARDLFMVNDARAEARAEFQKKYDLSYDDLDNLDDELKAELDELENGYRDNCVRFARETLSENMINEINCEDAEGQILHSYKIEWI